MPSAREWRARDAAAADRDVLERAARWLRESPERRAHAGLQHDHQTDGLAALVEVLGEHVAQLDPAGRSTVQSCRVLLRESMESPAIRRTRRR